MQLCPRRWRGDAKRCPTPSPGQKLAQAIVPWHNLVFAPEAFVRVVDHGDPKGLGLVARRDLRAADLRQLVLSVQLCTADLLSQLEDQHPSLLVSRDEESLQGILYGVGALINRAAGAPLRLGRCRSGTTARDPTSFFWKFEYGRKILRAGSELLAVYAG